MKKQGLIFIGLALFLSGCSSVMKVTADQTETSIYVQRDSLPERKLIGKTPLEVPPEEFIELIGGPANPGELIIFDFEKTGFIPERIQVPSQRFGMLVTEISAKLKPDVDAQKKQENLKTASDLINRLFLAQKFALSQQYERALMEIDRILEQYPTFARAISMKGSVYFAQKNYPESLKWYEEALKVDPQMDETIKMTAKVREMIAGRQPAGSKK